MESGSPILALNSIKKDYSDDGQVRIRRSRRTWLLEDAARRVFKYQPMFEQEPTASRPRKNQTSGTYGFAIDLTLTLKSVRYAARNNIRDAMVIEELMANVITINKACGGSEGGLKEAVDIAHACAEVIEHSAAVIDLVTDAVAAEQDDNDEASFAEQCKKMCERLDDAGRVATDAKELLENAEMADLRARVVRGRLEALQERTETMLQKIEKL